MRRIPLAKHPVAVAALVGAALVIPGATNSGAADGARAVATVRDAGNNVVARVFFNETSSGKVLVSARADGLTPGFHGFHVHTTGACVPPFTTAGPHYDPAGHSHGEHAGDLPVLLVQADGTAHATEETGRFRIAELFDADRSAIIIHVAADNYANIPSRYTSSTTGLPGPDEATLATGDSGGRFACGVIVRG